MMGPLYSIPTFSFNKKLLPYEKCKLIWLYTVKNMCSKMRTGFFPRAWDSPWHWDRSPAAHCWASGPGGAGQGWDSEESLHPELFGEPVWRTVATVELHISCPVRKGKCIYCICVDTRIGNHQMITVHDYKRSRHWSISVYLNLFTCWWCYIKTLMFIKAVTAGFTMNICIKWWCNQSSGCEDISLKTNMSVLCYQ